MEQITQPGGQTKKCPKCGEQIQSSAKKCRYCQADIRNWFARHKFITAILILIVIGIVIGASGDNDKEKKEGEKKAGGETVTEDKKTEEQTEVKAYGVNEDVTVDEVRWKVLSVKDRGNTLKASESKYASITKPKTTGGKFIQIKVEIENLGKEMKSASNLNIIDDKGREFIHSTDTSEWIPEGEEMFILANLNPNITSVFSDIYEVPADATGLKLQVGDLKMFGNKKAFINLGL